MDRTLSFEFVAAQQTKPIHQLFLALYRCKVERCTHLRWWCE